MRGWGNVGNSILGAAGAMQILYTLAVTTMVLHLSQQLLLCRLSRSCHWFPTKLVLTADASFAHTYCTSADLEQIHKREYEQPSLVMPITANLEKEARGRESVI